MPTVKRGNAGERGALPQRLGWAKLSLDGAAAGGAMLGHHRGQGRRRADGGGEAEAIAGEGERGWTSACMAGDW